MALVNILVEDPSPFITFSSGWSTNQQSNPTSSSWQDGNFRNTQTIGSTATLTFNGTGVSIHGSRKFDHGVYNILLDCVQQNFTGAVMVEDFQQPLYAVTGMPSGTHTIELANAENAFLDFDFAVIQTTIGTSADAQVYTTKVDDVDPSFIFSGDWGTDTVPTQKFGPGVRFTKQNGASVTFNFVGETVALYGSVNFDHSTFSAAVDGVASPISFDGNYSSQVEGTLLYLATNLPLGPHSVTLTNTGLSDHFLDVDFAVYNSSQPPPTASPTAAVPVVAKGTAPSCPVVSVIAPLNPAPTFAVAQVGGPGGVALNATTSAGSGATVSKPTAAANSTASTTLASYGNNTTSAIQAFSMSAAATSKAATAVSANTTPSITSSKASSGQQTHRCWILMLIASSTVTVLGSGAL